MTAAHTGPDTDIAAFEAFEAAGWERRARGYDSFLRAVTTRSAPAVLEAVRAGPGTRLLDVATGPGDVAGLAARRGATAIGVDIAEAMIALARRAWPDAGFRAADAHALPFPDGSFDAVTANFGILHFGRPERAVSEMARVLVAGGRVALTVWDRPERTVLFGAVLQALDACGAQPPDDVPDGPAFFRFSDDDELRALLTQGGFDDVTVRTLRFTHEVASAEEAWRGVVDGSVRTSALILGQAVAVQERLRSAFTEITERHRRGAALALPTSVKLAAGTRHHPSP